MYVVLFVSQKWNSQCHWLGRFLTLYVCEQVFFRAGVLGQMEELRDDRLSKIVSWMQAYIRGYLSRKEYKKLQEQRYGTVSTK